MKNDRLTLTVLALILLGAFVWAVFVPKTTVTEEVKKKISEQKNKSDLFMKGVTFSEVVNGIKYWEIRAITSKVNKDTQEALLNEVKGAFFSNGKQEVNFIAPRVSWDMRSKKIKMNDPVGYDNNFRFKTSDLNWSLDSNKIFTDSKILFESDDLRMNAKGFSADTAFENMTLMGAPFAEVKRNREVISINAAAFEVKGKTGVITAKGNATAKKGDLLITCDELSFNKNSNRIYFKGSVKMSLRDINASSDMAEYDVRTGLVSLSGQALAKRGDSTVSGRKLKIDTKNYKITVEGQTKIILQEEVMTKEFN